MKVNKIYYNIVKFIYLKTNHSILMGTNVYLCHLVSIYLQCRYIGTVKNITFFQMSAEILTSNVRQYT